MNNMKYPPMQNYKKTADAMADEIADYCKTKDKIDLDKVYKNISVPYEEMFLIYDKIFSRYFKAHPNIAPVVNPAFPNLQSILDHVWSISNGINFVIEYDALLKFKGTRLAKAQIRRLVELPDIHLAVRFADGTYSREMYYLLKGNDRELVDYGEGAETIFTLGCSYIGNTFIMPEMISEQTVIASIFPEMHSITNYRPKCKGCEFYQSDAIQFVSRPVRGNDSAFQDKEPNLKVCRLSKINKDKCTYFQAATITPDEMLSAIVFAAEKYLNRHTLNRKNSVHKRELDKIGAVSILRNNSVSKSTYGVSDKPILISEYKDNSKSQRKGSKHTFHSTPRQHIRQSHMRITKTGKQVMVKGCVVNKGKESGILYRIK